MPASHEADGCRLFNDESNYAEDVFSEHSDDNTDGTERIDSDDSEDSKNSNDSNNSDKEISEDDKLSSLKHYEVEKTTLDVKRLQQRRLKKTMIDNMDRVIELIADEKKLSREKRPEEPMYVDDLAEYLRVLLVTNEMEFLIEWLRVELILFCQVTGVTGNRPDALTQLRYRDLKLTLVRDPYSSAPRLCVGLIAHFTKTFLGMKDVNTFWLLEIIYDSTLVLSSHVFLLEMLFHIRAFKSPGIRRPEDLYSLGVLNGLNQQELSLWNDLADLFIFCLAVREEDDV
ncbi:hypothetical protein AJ78_08884 [Emergomyces pasteurianus Ep9510]|uniref:Uncharacterized protein n=1 Tax=Emergomyces pasteurianus Ep9510 TaxID=1447872 RepID=A0A1J9P0Y4_9EURO|nr:hypothetical protein AJ78_08884 [Emergomyces pasteurianus Ep9510]